MDWLMTCDPANVQYIMSFNFNNFPKGPKYKQIFKVLGDGIFNSDMDLWKNQRILLFNAEEVKSLVYLHAALCETLRLYQPIPLNHKEPLKPDMLPSGHTVHPKMTILLNVYSMGRMKSVWGEDCFEFKPRRWINEQGEFKYEPSYKFNSFGAGPRICLGKEVAFVQMKFVVSAIVYNYRIHVLEETPVVPATSTILHSKDGLITRISTI